MESFYNFSFLFKCTAIYLHLKFVFFAFRALSLSDLAQIKVLIGFSSK